MLKNYLKVALRNISRNKIYAVTNIVGLATAMMGFIVVALYVNYELSYDKFHNEVEDIRIVKMKYTDKYGGYFNNMLPAVFADAIAEEIPGIVATTATSTGVGSLTVLGPNNEEFAESYYQFQSSFFDIFSFEAQYGDLRNALNNPDGAVISERIALKYFKTENAVGKSINLGDKGKFVVRAILKDFPANSQFQPHIVLPLDATFPPELLNSWGMNGFFVYLKTDGKVDDSTLTKQLAELHKRNTPEEGMYTDVADLVSFSESYWEWSGSGASMNNRNKGLGADKDVMLICGVLAAFLMVIALANYVNLAVSRAIQRAKEVGIRKVNGALPSQLISQFLSESIVFSFISLIVAVVSLEFLMPSISSLMGVEFSINYLKPIQVILLLGYALFCGLLAGIYPAFFLSRFQPSKILKTKMLGNAKSKLLFKVLLWFQFTLCAFLISVMSIMNGQIEHYFNFDLGFTKEQVVAIRIPKGESGRAKLFVNEAMVLPQILGATLGPMPDGAPGFNTIEYGDKSVRYVANFGTNETFIPTLDVVITKGRNIDPDMTTDFTEGIIINQTLQQKLGLVNPIGKVLQMEGMDKTKMSKKVIAIIEDIHLQGPSIRTRPLAILPSKEVGSPRQSLLVKLDKNMMEKGLAALENSFLSYFDQDVMTYEFLDEAYSKNYHRVKRLTVIVNGVTTLIISVSLFGLFAMIAFSISFRMKEIGIRKVLGVSFFELQWTLSKLFIFVITLSLIVAIPLSYIMMDSLLDAFYNRLPLTWIHGLIVMSSIYGLAILTVLGKGISTLQLNPANILRND